MLGEKEHESLVNTHIVAPEVPQPHKLENYQHVQLHYMLNGLSPSHETYLLCACTRFKGQPQDCVKPKESLLGLLKRKLSLCLQRKVVKLGTWKICSSTELGCSNSDAKLKYLPV